MRPRDRYRFCWHSNFNGRGDRVYYHGPSSTGGMFFGVGDLEGNVVWEYLVPAMIYGHMCTHPSWDAMITDEFFSDDLVTAIFYKELDRTGAPRLQVLARHDTDWSTKYGQYAHPHCHVSPDGKWMTYNRAGARFAESRIAGGSVAGKGTAAKAAAHLAPLAPGDGRSDVYVVRIG